MRGDREDRDLALIGAVTPEEPVCGRRALLHVGLKNFLARVVRMLECMEKKR